MPKTQENQIGQKEALTDELLTNIAKFRRTNDDYSRTLIRLVKSICKCQEAGILSLENILDVRFLQEVEEYVHKP